jgi:hypothetical protein
MEKIVVLCTLMSAIVIASERSWSVLTKRSWPIGNVTDRERPRGTHWTWPRFMSQLLARHEQKALPATGIKSTARYRD